MRGVSPGLVAVAALTALVAGAPAALASPPQQTAQAATVPPTRVGRAVATAARARVAAGGLVGTVRDAAGDAVSGVAVVLRRRSVAPDALRREASKPARTLTVQGRFEFAEVAAGDYRLELFRDAELVGRLDSVRVWAGGVSHVEVRLQDTATTGAAGTAALATSASTSIHRRDDLRSLPLALDVWALLEQVVPGVVTHQFDVGGSQTGSQALLSGYGVSFGQNVFRLGHVEVTDADASGTSDFWLDLATAAAVEVDRWGHRADVQTPGIVVTVLPGATGDELGGSVQGLFELDALQASPTAFAGAEPPAELEVLSDVSVQLGGPVAGGRGWLFGTVRDLRVARSRPLLTDDDTTELPSFLARGSVRLREGGRLTGFWSRQLFERSHRGVARTVSPEAAWREDDTFDVVGIEGRTRVAGAELIVEGGLSSADLQLPRRPESDGASRLDLVTGHRDQAPQFEFVQGRRRWQLQGRAGYLMLGGAQRLQLGGRYQGVRFDLQRLAVEDVQLVTSSGQPFLAVLWNTPVCARQSLDTWGVWVHDDWTPDPRLRVTAGVRFDHSSGGWPEQVSGAGRFAGERRFAAADVVDWADLVPRLAFAYEPSDRWGLTIRGSFSVYAHRLSGSILSLVNPNAPGFRLVPWSDTDGDGAFDAGEGGTTVESPVTALDVPTVDADLAAPLTREATLGIDLQLADEWVAAATLIYRRSDDLVEDIETALNPVADFARLVVRDPGPDNLAFTDDDVGLAVLDQLRGFGLSALRVVNLAAKEATFRGAEIGLRGRGARWSLATTLTLEQADGVTGKTGLVAGDPGGPSDLGDDPNALLNADARLSWDRTVMLKAVGTARLPAALDVGVVLRSQSGAPLARIVPVPLNQGIVDVFAARRGSERLQPVTTVDVGLRRRFDIGHAAVEMMLDVFNLLDDDTIVRVGETFPSYGVALGAVPPRVMRFGARLDF